MGSAKALTMIGNALAWLLSSAGKILLRNVGLTLTVGATVVDQVAWMLQKAAAISAEMGAKLKALMLVIMRFLGRAAIQIADVTFAFLRYVLDLLYTTLRATAQRALVLMGGG
jgi:triacylglycerol lipase